MRALQWLVKIFTIPIPVFYFIIVVQWVVRFDLPFMELALKKCNLHNDTTFTTDSTFTFAIQNQWFPLFECTKKETPMKRKLSATKPHQAWWLCALVPAVLSSSFCSPILQLQSVTLTNTLSKATPTTQFNLFAKGN